MPSAACVHNLSNLMAEPILSSGYGPPLGYVPSGEWRDDKGATVDTPLAPTGSGLHHRFIGLENVERGIDRNLPPCFSGRPAFVRAKSQFEGEGSGSKPCSA